MFLFALLLAGMTESADDGLERSRDGDEPSAGLAREFRVRERQTLEIRAEGQNVLNRTNFGLPSGDLNNANFGRIQTSGEARVMQFAVKYLF